MAPGAGAIQGRLPPGAGVTILVIEVRGKDRWIVKTREADLIRQVQAGD